MATTKPTTAVQFPLDEPVPSDLLERMARFQAEWNETESRQAKNR